MGAGDRFGESGRFVVIFRSCRSCRLKGREMSPATEDPHLDAFARWSRLPFSRIGPPVRRGRVDRRPFGRGNPVLRPQTRPPRRPGPRPAARPVGGRLSPVIRSGPVRFGPRSRGADGHPDQPTVRVIEECPGFPRFRSDCPPVTSRSRLPDTVPPAGAGECGWKRFDRAA